MIVEIADCIDNGWFLAAALDRHPREFPPYYRALVRSAEDAGNLGAVLARLAEPVERDAQTARRAAGFALYPAALSVMALILTALVLAFGTPRFSSMVAGTLEEPIAGDYVFLLPQLAGTLALLAFLVFGGIAVFCFLGPRNWRSLANEFAFLGGAASWLRWHAPFFSRYERRRAVAQYALVAGRLMEAGIATHEALHVAASASGNACCDGMAARAADLVEEGRTFSEALARADPRRRLPREFVWYVEVGERTGRLPEAMLRASDVADARSRSVLSRLVSLIFPLGVVTVALVVGMLGYAVFKTLVIIMEGMGL